MVYTPKPTVTAENAFSTYAERERRVVQDRLCQSAVEQLPQPSDVRSEEFLNALEYRDRYEPVASIGNAGAVHA